MIILQPITTQQIVQAIPRSNNLQTDLVTNGDFSNGTSNWIFLGDVSVVSGKVVFSNTDELSFIKQQNILTIGKSYYVFYEISNYTEGGLKLTDFGDGTTSSDTNLNESNGIFAAQGIAGNVDLEVKRRSNPVTQTLDNIAVIEIDSANLISVVVTEEGTQRTETITSVAHISNLYYRKFYITFSILKEDNFYTLDFIQNNATIHKAKAYCTSQTASSFSINNNQYNFNTDNSNFITL